VITAEARTRNKSGVGFSTYANRTILTALAISFPPFWSANASARETLIDEIEQSNAIFTRIGRYAIAAQRTSTRTSRGRQQCTLADKLLHTFYAQHLAACVEDLGDAVGVKEDPVTRSQVHLDESRADTVTGNIADQ
jgi:hypothetical protein